MCGGVYVDHAGGFFIAFSVFFLLLRSIVVFCQQIASSQCTLWTPLFVGARRNCVDYTLGSAGCKIRSSRKLFFFPLHPALELVYFYLTLVYQVCTVNVGVVGTTIRLIRYVGTFFFIFYIIGLGEGLLCGDLVSLLFRPVQLSGMPGASCLDHLQKVLLCACAIALPFPSRRRLPHV